MRRSWMSAFVVVTLAAGLVAPSAIGIAEAFATTQFMW